MAGVGAPGNDEASHVHRGIDDRGAAGTRCDDRFEAYQVRDGADRCDGKVLFFSGMDSAVRDAGSFSRRHTDVNGGACG